MFDDESIYSKEPVYQFETQHLAIREIMFRSGDPGARSTGMGKYSVWLDSGGEMEFDIPLDKCLLDPRKTYALRLSVFEV